MKKQTRFLLVRCFLLLLICLQLLLIFGFSSEEASVSDKTSQQVSEKVAKVVVEDYEQLPVEEQRAAVKRIDPPVRKIAHVTEFGVLGGLFFLLFLTFPMPMWLSYLLSILASALFASLDEWHQTMVPGRSGSARDVLIDTAGAFLVASILLLLSYLCKLNRTKVVLKKVALAAPVCARVAIVADLHGRSGNQALKLIKQNRPDLILIPGDLADRESLERENARFFAFLQKAVELAPTYYSLGNHEVDCYRKGLRKNHTPLALTDTARENIAKTGAILLDNTFVYHDGISICGLSSNGGGKGNAPWTPELANRFLEMPGYKILLCHHPEQFDRFIKPYAVDLTISGHAHGGQWRIFGRGIYAPDQDRKSVV